MVYVVSSPLKVSTSKLKWFLLNLNVFRNAHFHVLNKAKHTYEEDVSVQVSKLPWFNRAKLTLKLYPKTKRLCDLDNVLSIHTKFFQDTLVRANKIEDDNYLFIPAIDYRFGEVDKDNPRVEITIEEYVK